MIKYETYTVQLRQLGHDSGLLGLEVLGAGLGKELTTAAVV
jgi:hypothetical protein